MSNRVGTNKAGATAIVGLVATDELRNLRADMSTHALQTIDYSHHEIHAGSHYFFTDANTVNAASTDYVDYLLVVPDTAEYPHMFFESDGSAITGFYLYEGANKASSDYIEATVYNNNRNSTDVATTGIFYKIGSGDATSDFGDLIYEYYGGATSGKSKIPSDTRQEAEIILKRNTKYIFRTISGTASNLVNVKFSWYEHTDKT
jgi:hypothetical protein